MVMKEKKMKTIYMYHQDLEMKRICVNWNLWFFVTLLTNFDFYFCVKFHKSSLWVPIFAAGGP